MASRSLTVYECDLCKATEEGDDDLPLGWSMIKHGTETDNHEMAAGVYKCFAGSPPLTLCPAHTIRVTHNGDDVLVQNLSHVGLVRRHCAALGPQPDRVCYWPFVS